MCSGVISIWMVNCFWFSEPCCSLGALQFFAFLDHFRPEVVLVELEHQIILRDRHTAANQRMRPPRNTPPPLTSSTVNVYTPFGPSL